MRKQKSLIKSHKVPMWEHFRYLIWLWIHCQIFANLTISRHDPISYLQFIECYEDKNTTIPFSVTTGCSKKKYSGLILNNSEASEAITLKYILLDRGKVNLDFDILQLYIYKKLTEILMFKFGSIFLVVSKICEKRCIEY